MPLPLPNLDTRRFDDLVEEARALVPRYAPGWTDHNLHDPGITLVELLAYLVEADLYRANRIGPDAIRMFLELVGRPPAPPRPARVPLSVTLDHGAGLLSLPAGTVLATGGADDVSFQTSSRLNVAPTALAAVQTFDGRAFDDVTPLVLEGVAIPALGAHPILDSDESPALLLGFDRPLPSRRLVSLWLAFDGSRDDGAALRAEAEATRLACRPLAPRHRCGDEPLPPPPLRAAPPHHSLRTVWDVLEPTGWEPLRARDGTRSLSADGVVVVQARHATTARQTGVVPRALHWIRCRVEGGEPDEAPMLVDAAVNAVVAEQRTPVTARIPLAEGVAPPVPPLAPGRRVRLALDADEDARLTRVGRTYSRRVARTRVVGAGADALESEALLLGIGTGLPGQSFELPAGAVAEGELALWSPEPDEFVAWRRVGGFEAAGPDDRVYALDASGAFVRFGDGLRGRVPREGAPVFGAYSATAGAAGNVPASTAFELAPTALNEAVLRRAPADVPVTLRTRRAAAGGADAEDAAAAAAAAAAELWAHERLLELAPAPGATLDGLDPAVVLGLAAPARAATLLDFERLALAVPGTRVRRARAWGGLDPDLPGVTVPGTVTVVVVNGWPAARPHPSAALLDVVERYLRRRKTIGTRLRVVGPAYLEVTVRAGVAAVAGADPAAVESRVAAALARFLDPLVGGPAGRGWPFGRDVYRAELLALVDGVEGVDHVTRLTVEAAGAAAECTNVCVGPTQLVVSGGHVVEAA